MTMNLIMLRRSEQRKMFEQFGLFIARLSHLGIDTARVFFLLATAAASFHQLTINQHECKHSRFYEFQKKRRRESKTRDGIFSRAFVGDPCRLTRFGKVVRKALSFESFPKALKSNELWGDFQSFQISNTFRFQRKASYRDGTF